MAKKNHPDERVVYLALKNVFKEIHAGIRQPKAIHKLVTKHKKHTEVADLLREHDMDTVCNVARILLTEQIFESTLKAKLRFPEVFDMSPAQSAEWEASEAEAARNEANAIKDAVQGHQDSTNEVIQSEEAAESESVETHKNHGRPAPKAPFHIPSLFPVYLPFSSQHFLLAKVQTILERACFDFGQQTMPYIMRKNRWDCPESAELNLWATEFLKGRKVFDKRKDVGQSLESLFRSVADIRHAAVHRIRVSARGLEQFMVDTESLATLLDHSSSLTILSKLRRDTQMAIEELERNKHILSSKLEETRKSIASQREELDRLEKLAISEMIREDSDYQQFAGKNLLEGITPEEATVLSVATTEKGTDSDAESADNDKDSSCTECPPGDWNDISRRFRSYFSVTHTHRGAVKLLDVSSLVLDRQSHVNTIS